MGYIIRANCPSCNYQSPKLVIGTALYFVFVCKTCKSVVNPQSEPFRYTYPNCPNCQQRLSRSEFVDAGYLPIARDEFVESNYLCPRCGNANLTFKEVAHLSTNVGSLHPDDRHPKKGVIVHGTLDDAGYFLVPDLSVSGLHLENPPADAQNKIMELRVTRVQYTPAPPPSLDKVDIYFEFIRFLSDDDLAQIPIEPIGVTVIHQEMIDLVLNEDD